MSQVPSAPRRQRRRLTFTKRDVTRAIKAVGGLERCARVEIDPTGKIIIVPGEPEKADLAPQVNNPGEEWD